MAGERVPCMNCRELIDPAASVCPYCRGIPRPISAKDPFTWGCVLPMALVIFGIVGFFVWAFAR